MEGTTALSSTAFPGWYVNFQAALLQQAPRPGELDQETAEGWAHNQAALKKILAEGLLPRVSAKDEGDNRFELIKTINLVVPGNYVHATRLASFKKENYENFFGYNSDITDKNYARVTNKLVPGQKGKVKIFQIKEPVSALDCLKKLKKERAILVGAQGASLVWELKKKELPLGKWGVSFDKKEVLWRNGLGDHRVPKIFGVSDGAWYFDLSDFEGDWGGDSYLLCFCDFQ